MYNVQNQTCIRLFDVDVRKLTLVGYRTGVTRAYLIYTVFRKNTHSYFLSYLHEWCVDLNKNYSEYIQDKVVSDNVEIRYSLRPMT